MGGGDRLLERFLLLVIPKLGAKIGGGLLSDVLGKLVGVYKPNHLCRLAGNCFELCPRCFRVQCFGDWLDSELVYYELCTFCVDFCRNTFLVQESC